MQDGEDADDLESLALWTREETPLLLVPLHFAAGLPPLEIRQHPTASERWSIAGSVWSGAIGLLSFLGAAGDRYPLGGANVLELGSGTGVLGIGLAVGLGANVVLSDLPEAMPLLEENAQRNAGAARAACVRWGGAALPEEVVSHLAAPGDALVVGSDIVYRGDLFDPLLETLSACLGVRPGIRCLMATQFRGAQQERFWESARRRGFAVREMGSVAVPEDVEAPPVLGARAPPGAGDDAVYVYEMELAAP